MSYPQRAKVLRRPTNEEFARRIAAAVDRGLSGRAYRVQVLARLINVSPSTAKNILAGKHVCSGVTLMVLAAAFSEVRAVVNEMMGQGQAPAEERLEQIKALLLERG